jgi:hypothetical protein
LRTRAAVKKEGRRAPPFVDSGDFRGGLIGAASTAGAKPTHNRRVGRGGRHINEHLGSRARRLAGNIEQVLDTYNRSIERAESYAVPRSRVGRVGGVAGGLRIHSKAGAGTLALWVSDARRACSRRSRAERGGGAPILGVCSCARTRYGDAKSAVAAPAKCTMSAVPSRTPLRIVDRGGDQAQLRLSRPEISGEFECALKIGEMSGVF